ncbi:hypothetical protein OHB39_03510 [Streptomyces sp. NBC_00047]|uniref:hypothetical protein n=1 Tax=Streptomyces sp. NBC_00047 TaxID=2975627 RepID=UPI002251822C|nr:hypothetical protein [Streptomyces sp. NBC_00047]MCX5606664.1 hypothetical protein [Streptomyces sp. NBC_00047]
MAMFRRSNDEQRNETADELALLRTEFGQELRSGLVELRGLNAELRQQLGTSLESGLQDLRDDLRELRRELNDAHKSITDSRRESESLRLELEATRREAAEARIEPPGKTVGYPSQPALPPIPGPTATPAAYWQLLDAEIPDADISAPVFEGQPPETFGERTLDLVLEQAAGISAADLICHRDAWAFIVEQAAQNSHFRLPGIATSGDDDEQTHVTISGRTLIAILSALHTTQHSQTTSLEDRALAATYCSRITSVINDAVPLQSNATRTRIVIDDRPPSASA